MRLNVQCLTETFERLNHENGGSSAFGLRFYNALLLRSPEFEVMFLQASMESQTLRMMVGMASMIYTLAVSERLTPFLQALGIRHAAWGIKPEHYQVFIDTFVDTLGEHLAAEGEWTEAMADTWRDVLGTLSDVMTTAAANPKALEDQLQAAGYLPDGARVDGKAPWVMVPDRTAKPASQKKDNTLPFSTGTADGKASWGLRANPQQD